MLTARQVTAQPSGVCLILLCRTDMTVQACSDIRLSEAYMSGVPIGAGQVHARTAPWSGRACRAASAVRVPGVVFMEGVCSRGLGSGWGTHVQVFVRASCIVLTPHQDLHPG